MTGSSLLEICGNTEGITLLNGNRISNLNPDEMKISFLYTEIATAPESSLRSTVRLLQSQIMDCLICLIQSTLTENHLLDSFIYSEQKQATSHLPG